MIWALATVYAIGWMFTGRKLAGYFHSKEWPRYVVTHEDHWGDPVHKRDGTRTWGAGRSALWGYSLALLGWVPFGIGFSIVMVFAGVLLAREFVIDTGHKGVSKLGERRRKYIKHLFIAPPKEKGE